MLKRLLFVVACIGFVGLFSGCPDYSHLREEPDYENMIDGDEKFEEEGEGDN